MLKELRELKVHHEQKTYQKSELKEWVEREDTYKVLEDPHNVKRL